MEIVQEKIIVPADRSRLAQLRSVVRKVCLQNGVSPRTVQRVVLVIDEAVSNVMEHSGARREDMIRIALEIAEESINVEITDPGVQFDPSDRESTRTPRNTRGRKPFK